MKRVFTTLLLVGATALGQIDNPPTSTSILDATAVGRSLLTASNAEAARTSIGALATNGSAVGLTNFPTVPLASNVTGTIAISNGGSGATTAGGARTNLGLGNISTNTYLVTNTAVYINTNIVATNGTLKSINIQSDYIESFYVFVGDGLNGIKFETPDVAAITRTNLGIGAGATNTVGFGKIRLGAGLIIEEPNNDGAIITFPNDTDPVVLGTDYWNHGSVRQSLGFSTNLSNFWTSASIAAARTNLGLGGGITTNVTFVDASTNTNSVTISNGIITGWTQ